MKEFEKETGKRIRALREKMGYSRETLSEMANIGSKFLYEIEFGKKGMSAYTLFNLANALNTSCDYLLTGAEKEGNYSDIFHLLSTMTPEEVAQIEKILFHIAEIRKLK